MGPPAQASAYFPGRGAYEGTPLTLVGTNPGGLRPPSKGVPRGNALRIHLHHLGGHYAEDRTVKETEEKRKNSV